ncbi:MAG: hypothetical protein HYR56_31200 [Acidobacteria bacterium]|nr:hypothetical protein [Acidobacteriota bacterium]MBI3424145.1 hypothetical protein [Acidobacteriota bacterium]
MRIAEVVRDIHALDADLENYERKYGVLSATFYEAYRAGEELADDAWVLDWSDWAGAYENWLQRRQQYQELMRNLIAHSPLSEVFKRAARREPLELAHLNTRNSSAL